MVPFYSNPSRAQYVGNVFVPQGEGGLISDSVAVGHQVRVANLNRFNEILGTLSETYMTEIELAVAYCLGIAM